MWKNRLRIDLVSCRNAATRSYDIETSFGKWLSAYEDFVGLTAVKLAQQNVIQAETNFVDIQQKRREKQHYLSTIQVRLKNLNTELEKIPRTDDKYLALLTEEHTIIKDEQLLRSEVEDLEMKERDQFTLLSTALRDSHAKESAQAERTKYWSIGGSLIGACIGIIGTTVNNRLRMRELKSMILSKETTSVVSDKLHSIEQRIDKVNELLSEGAATQGPDASADSSTSVPEVHCDASTQVLERIDAFEREALKTVVYTTISLVVLILCYNSL